MAENNVKDFKAPPALGKDTLYVNWKREIKIWEAFTSLPDEKKAPAIFMTLIGEAREAVLNMDIEKLTDKLGVKYLIEELDKMYLKDESSQAYEAYECFEKFVRPHGMSISDYVIKFEQLYFKAKSFRMEIHDGVLAYRLLNSANLTLEQKQLVKATISKMDYSIMKDQLRKVFTSDIVKDSSNNVKIEDEVKIEEDEIFYSSGRGHNYNRFKNKRRGRDYFNYYNNKNDKVKDSKYILSKC